MFPAIYLLTLRHAFFIDNRHNIARMGRHNENRQKDNSARIWYGLYIVRLFIFTKIFPTELVLRYSSSKYFQIWMEGTRPEISDITNENLVESPTDLETLLNCEKVGEKIFNLISIF